MSSTSTFVRGLTDPERQAEIQALLPDEALEPDRTFMPFCKPYWRRLTEYEALMLYTQCSNDAIAGSQEIGEVVQKWPGGRSPYSNESTEAQSTNWFGFRDPDKIWFFPYVRNKTEEGRFTDRFLKAYSLQRQDRAMDPDWKYGVLDKVYGAFLYNEYGLFNAHSSICNTALSDLIRPFASQIGFDKNDASQMIQMQRLFLHKLDDKFPESLEDAKDTWMNDPIYQAGRETVEELWQGTCDWVEGLWAIHEIFDEIYGQFVRRDFFQKVAPHFGDSLTPWIAAQATTYHCNVKPGMTQLVDEVLIGDEKFGEHNLICLQAWTEKWLPETIKSLKGFMKVYTTHLPREIPGVTDKASVEATVRQVLTDWAEVTAAKINFDVDVDALVADVMSGY